jgi:mono/diheme cytochrome c family protein
MAVDKRIQILLVLLFAGTGCRERVDASSDAGSEPDSPVTRGELAVQQRNCGQCHQSPNPSDGVLSGQTTPVPGSQAYGSNLTPDPDTGMDAWDVGTIVAALTQGVDSQGNPLCPAMPAYCDMTPDEANSIAVYLQSLTPVWHPVPASVCPPYEPLPDSGIPVLRTDTCGD